MAEWGRNGWSLPHTFVSNPDATAPYVADASAGTGAAASLPLSFEGLSRSPRRPCSLARTPARRSSRQGGGHPRRSRPRSRRPAPFSGDAGGSPRAARRGGRRSSRRPSRQRIQLDVPAGTARSTSAARGIRAEGARPNTVEVVDKKNRAFFASRPQFGLPAPRLACGQCTGQTKPGACWSRSTKRGSAPTCRWCSATRSTRLPGQCGRAERTRCCPMIAPSWPIGAGAWDRRSSSTPRGGISDNGRHRR